jgi:hypothetical protein
MKDLLKATARRAATCAGANDRLFGLSECTTSLSHLGESIKAGGGGGGGGGSAGCGGGCVEEEEEDYPVSFFKDGVKVSNDLLTLMCFDPVNRPECELTAAQVRNLDILAQAPRIRNSI